MKKSKALLDKIITELEQGRTMTDVCRSKGFPGVTTINRWKQQDSKFAAAVLEARKTGALLLLDQMQDLLMQEVEPTKVQWYRERLHHFRWLASKLISTFGDKQTVENVGEPQIQIVWKGEDDPAQNLSTTDKQTELAHTTRASAKTEH